MGMTLLVVQLLWVVLGQSPSIPSTATLDVLLSQGHTEMPALTSMNVLFQTRARTITFAKDPISQRGHSNQMQRDVPLEQLWGGKAETEKDDRRKVMTWPIL